MFFMRTIRLLALGLVLGLTAMSVAAQASVTVPDLTGLNVPQATAALNRLGLRLGNQTGEHWTSESGMQQNLIRTQEIAPGTTVEAGAAVNVTVLRTPNIILIYDDNDLTLVNQSGVQIDLQGLVFRAKDGNGASFNATRWSEALRANQCMQIWTVGRNGPKGIDECGVIQNWLVTTDGGEHFWTGAGGTTQFAILQNEVEMATCPVANPGRCEFYFPVGPAGDGLTEYVYFAYTTDALAIINTSEDRWMPIGQLVVRNNYAQPVGAAVNVGSAEIFGNPDIVGVIRRLAPNQCLFFTNSAPEAQTPQPCDVIARLDIGANVIFWGADFPVESITDDQERSCPAAIPGKLTLCILPR